MKHLQALRRLDWLLAPVLGLLAATAFPPYDLKPLAPLALLALLMLAADVGTRRAALLGGLFGFAHFAGGIYWIYISTHVYGGAPAWLSLILCAVLFSYMALYPALVLGAAARLRLFNSAWGYLGLPALWLLAELLRGWVYSGFPWLALGYVALDLPPQRWAPILGVHGVSALIVLMVFSLYRALSQKGRARQIALGVMAVLIVATLLLPAPGAWTRDRGAPLNAAIVQGNIAQDQKWLPEMQVPTLLRYRDLTRSALGADVIIWPEVALAQPYHVLRASYLDPLAQELRERNAALLFGTLIREPDDSGYHNSMLALGSAEGRYDKRHLVPFGEYFPIPDWLRPVMDVLSMKYSDFLFGAADQPPVMVRGVPIGFYICFEDVFASEVAQTARDDALIVNVTNDAWFGRSGAAEQHLQMARYRSLETGRATLRASNTGPSAVIGADGRVLEQAGFFSTEVLRGTVQPREGLTPFMRWRHVPLWLLSIFVVASLFWLRRKPA